MLGKCGDKIGIRVDLAAVKFQNDIVRLQTGLFRAAAFRHGHDLRSGGQAVNFRDLCVEILQRDAEIGPAADAAILLQVIHHAQHVVDGNGEAEPFDGHARLRRSGYLRGRNADDIAVHIEQRPAGVAGVDSRVGLQHIDDRSVGVDLGGRRIVKNGGHGERQIAQRISDGLDCLADLDLVGIADRDGLQALCLDLQKRNVVHAVRADDGGGVFLARIELHDDGPLVRIRDDVVIGDDIAVLRQDEAAARAYAGRFHAPEVGCDLRGNAADRADVHLIDLRRRERFVALVGSERFRQGRPFEPVGGVGLRLLRCGLFLFDRLLSHSADRGA